MTRSILYIVNAYGTPPLNYFERYIKENRAASITILKLPAIRSAKHKMNIDTFIKDEENTIYELKLNLFFPFPYFLIFIFQYLINFILFFILLSKIKRKRFDIVIGETNFGSFLSYIVRKLGIANYSVFFNGDIIPDPLWSNRCFFLPNNDQNSWLYKSVDNLLIRIQYVLRGFGYRNNLIWFANTKIAYFDSKRGLHSKHSITNDPILVDYQQILTYETDAKKMDTICYIGRIDDYVGLDIIIPALNIIKKTIPKIRLIIIGGNDVSFEMYRRLAIKNHVLERITYYGYIQDVKKTTELMHDAALGIALYKPCRDNVSMYTQPGKPKEYIKLGIPVLLSKNGPEIGREIVRYNAGIESHFDIEEVSKTIIHVLTDTTLYQKLRKGTLRFAKAYDYRFRCKKIVDEMFSIMSDVTL